MVLKIRKPERTINFLETFPSNRINLIYKYVFLVDVFILSSTKTTLYNSEKTVASHFFVFNIHY